MAKQTIPVGDIRLWVNERLEQMQDSNLYGITTPRDFRSGMIAVLEMVLHSTGNYSGFQELLSEDRPKTELECAKRHRYT